MAREASAAGAKEALTAIALASRLGQVRAMIRTLLFAALHPRRRARHGAGRAPVDEAQAVGAAGAFDVSGELDLMSDYRFRGVSRSDEDPAAQAGLTVRHESGLYAGARGTTLQGRSTAFGCAIRPSAIRATSSSISMPATAATSAAASRSTAG